jgi:hypothetical protein
VRKNNPVKEKGLMSRRKSFSQASVPNAKKGSNKKPQFVMIVVFLAIVVASLLLARLSV